MKDFLWVEKYRPKTIQDCILVDDIKDTFQNFVNNKEVPNLLLAGGPGMGKTTIAFALCNELELDYIVLNGSKENGIDQVRNRITSYASSVSLTSSPYKMIIFDEADYVTNEAQAALRRLIEEFSSNCKFILTCNFINKIIPALHSRCSVIEFKIPKKIQGILARKFMKRMEYILTEEDIEYDSKALAEVIMKFIPDWRRCINELQRYSANGIIDIGILSSIKGAPIDNLISYMKEGDFNKVRKWIASNMDNDSQSLLKTIYLKLYEEVQEVYIPEVVLTIAEYSYKSAFVMDQEINLLACILHLMGNSEFKK